MFTPKGVDTSSALGRRHLHLLHVPGLSLRLARNRLHVGDACLRFHHRAAEEDAPPRNRVATVDLVLLDPLRGHETVLATDNPKGLCRCARGTPAGSRGDSREHSRQDSMITHPCHDVHAIHAYLPQTESQESHTEQSNQAAKAETGRALYLGLDRPSG